MTVNRSQSLILAARHPGARTKPGSVFEAVWGPAANREPSGRLTILTASPDWVAIDGTTGGAAHTPPRSTELYTQTQRILNQESHRSVYLDVHA